MENCKGGLKSYWKKYKRLDGEHGRRRRTRRSRVDLGGGGAAGGGGRRFWRIKISPRLRLLSRLRRLTPRRILAGFRDAYVRMMLVVARSGAISGGGFGYEGPRVGGFGRPVQMKEYDEKALVQMYRSIITQSQLGAGGGAVDTGSGGARIAV